MALISRRTSGAQPENLQLVALANWEGETAVLLRPSDELDKLAGRLDRVSLVAIEFPNFTDGRGYSLARLLRERHGFKGEIRAVGEVLRDTLFHLSRCGFDSFQVSDGSSAEDALESLGDFSETYQASVEQPVPLFRRRAA